MAHPELSSLHERYIPTKGASAEAPPAWEKGDKGKPFSSVPIPPRIYVVPGWEWEFVYVQIWSGGSVDSFALIVHIWNPQDSSKLWGTPTWTGKLPQGVVVLSPHHHIQISFGPVEGVLRFRGHVGPHRHGFTVRYKFLCQGSVVQVWVYGRGGGVENQEPRTLLLQSRGHLLPPQIHGRSVQERHIKPSLLQDGHCGQQPVGVPLHPSPGSGRPPGWAAKIFCHWRIEHKNISHAGFLLETTFAYCDVIQQPFNKNMPLWFAKQKFAKTPCLEPVPRADSLPW